MARLQGVGQVAEWFKAAVLKTHTVERRKSRFPRNSNENEPRILRRSRIVHRFAMAQMSSQMNSPRKGWNRCEGLTNREGTTMAKRAFIPILPYIQGPRGGQILERFWSKVDKRGPDECWDWNASLTDDGYGRFKIGSYVQVQANRVSLVIATGIEHLDLGSLHSCDRPICCNDNHLRWGTVHDNMADKMTRNRWRGASLGGETNPRAVLKPEQVEDIIWRLKRYEQNTSIARVHGISHSMVSRIRLGKSWVDFAASLGWEPAQDKIDRLRDSTPYAGEVGKPWHCNSGIICGEGKRG